MKKGFFVTIGLLSLGLGILGMALPILPTTPFLLLSAAMFMRSSERLTTWLFNHKVFGAQVRNYFEHKAVDKRSKILAMALLWPTILISAWMIERVWFKVALILIAIAVSAHVLSLKTAPSPQDKLSDSDSENQDPQD